MEMLLTGEMIDAVTALEFGLVNRVVPQRGARRRRSTDYARHDRRQIACRGEARQASRLPAGRDEASPTLTNMPPASWSRTCWPPMPRKASVPSSKSGSRAGKPRPVAADAGAPAPGRLAAFARTTHRRRRRRRRRDRAGGTSRDRRPVRTIHHRWRRGGGGGGGGGHGASIATTVPSGQVWVFGVVAHAETATVATIISAIRLIWLFLTCSFVLTTMP